MMLGLAGVRRSKGKGNRKKPFGYGTLLLFLAILLFHYFVTPRLSSYLYDHSPAASRQVDTSDALDSRVDLNSASPAELATLPGIGDELAKRIVIRRDVRGKFGFIEELKEVRGIGDKKFDAVREYVVVQGKEVDTHRK